MIVMIGKVAVAMVLAVLAVPVLSGQTSAVGGAACGDGATQFSVKEDRARLPPGTPAGKALIYFVERDTGIFFPPITRVGVDGKWVGATHGASYISFAVDPGVHHFCAMTQSSDGSQASLAHVTAKAGEVYYFEVKAVSASRGSGVLWTDRSLTALDSDEGELLVRDSAYSTGREKN
jgi:hypothetical protein